MFNNTEGESGEVSEIGDKDTKLVAGLSATKLVDDQFAVESTELEQIGEHKKVRLADRHVCVCVCVCVCARARVCRLQ